MEVEISNFLPKDNKCVKLFEKEAHISLMSYNVQHGFWRTKEKET